MASKNNSSSNRRRNNQTNNKKRQSSQGNKKNRYEDEEPFAFKVEIVIWIMCAFMLILELGNFGYCGFMNVVSKFFFGIFGMLQYILPIAIIFSAFFLHVNEYKKRAVSKVIFGTLVFLFIGVLCQLFAGMDEYSIHDLYFNGYKDKIGGGILCGSLAYALFGLIGKAGTYIVILLSIVVCIIALAEISVIDVIRSIMAGISEDFETVRENAKTEEEELSLEERRQARKKQKESSKVIVEEDYPDEEPKSKNSPKSVLAKIAVLPSEDSGFVDSGVSATASTKDEIHEITMDYEIPLPGENMDVVMDNFDVSHTPKDEQVVPSVLEATTNEEIMVPQPKVASAKTKSVLKNKLDDVNLDEQDIESEPVKSVSKNNRSKTKTTGGKGARKDDSDYQFPSYDFLSQSNDEQADSSDEMAVNAQSLVDVLGSFGVGVTMQNYSCGPSVTRYEMVPDQGVKVSKITGLADDLMMNLAAQSIRIEAPIPGKRAVGIEIPNEKRSGVGFRELIDSPNFIKHPSKISFAVGKDIEGNVIVEDIAKMPHLLIAGATGSGKSVCTNTLIMSILYKARPDEVKLILVDPKQVELKVYNGIPHLLTPVVTDPKKAAGALNWAVGEMTRRYQLFSECNVRNIHGYNAKVKEIMESNENPDVCLKSMYQIVIIVDELADLMMVAKAEVEEAIVRLAQLARAAGIHLVIATQRPSVDVVTGLIKANVPSRIALSVSSGVDSRTIIDTVGAEKLLGNGDMLFYPTNYPQPLRVQGAYISDDEVMRVVDFLVKQNKKKDEEEEAEDISLQFTTKESSTNTVAINGGSESDNDEYFIQAGRYIIEKNKASIGMLQRMFKIGFNRAARIMDQLHEAGVVGPEDGPKARQILMTMEEFEAYLDSAGDDGATF